jgi:hypothetical protein
MNLGRIPDGGGSVHGRTASVDHRHKPVPSASTTCGMAIDDLFPAAHIEVLDDERVDACAGSLIRGGL